MAQTISEIITCRKFNTDIRNTIKKARNRIVFGYFENSIPLKISLSDMYAFSRHKATDCLPSVD